MKKTIKLSEEKLEKIISTIIEQVQNLDDYGEEDFVEAFLITFREWITEKLGDESKKYPLSYFLRKYGREFEESMGTSVGYGREYTGLDRYRIISVAKNIIRKGKYHLPIVTTETKFTDRYKKMLSHFFEKNKIPEYSSLDIIENEPNKVFLEFKVDFPKMITSETTSSTIKPDSILYDLKKFLQDYGGAEFGNPIYGQVDMRSSPTEYLKLDDWVKNVLNKKLKKEIKTLPGGNSIHAIRFEPTSNGAAMKLNFKDSFNGSRSKVVSTVKEYLESQGYNTEVLKVGW
jgi:hypothetical protein